MSELSATGEYQDYARVARAISYLHENYRNQPGLEEIAAQVHLSPYHFQRLFSRWAGVSPKKFVEALTLTEAKAQLRSNLKPLLELSGELGLGSSSRLHDHFVQLEGVTPAQYREYGEGMEMTYGVASSPFGDIWIANTARGICRLWFSDLVEGGDFLRELQEDWSAARLRRDDQQAKNIAFQLFVSEATPDRVISLLVKGTNFQMNVWRALLNIPFGDLTSYSDIARVIGHPNAVRAVGSAVGANPIAFLIPCHRVIRADGAMGGYRGGLTRKRAMLAWEKLRAE